MKSAWVCSLNDVAANVAVLVANAAVALTASGWPDIIVGLLIAIMSGESAISVIRVARTGLRRTAIPVYGGHVPAGFSAPTTMDTPQHWHPAHVTLFLEAYGRAR